MVVLTVQQAIWLLPLLWPGTAWNDHISACSGMPRNADMCRRLYPFWASSK